MASLMIHQIVGEEYCKRHKVQSEYMFLNGNLVPDLVKDKKPTHFSARCRNRTYTESIQNKVNLQAFCEAMDIESSFNKGFFLHLITDQVFFYKYLLNNPRYRAIEHENQLDIQEILYRDYYRNNKYLMEKYPNAILSMVPSFAKVTRDDVDAMEILSNEDIDEIIEMCASVDLEQAYAKIKQMTQDIIEM